VPAVVDDNW